MGLNIIPLPLPFLRLQNRLNQREICSYCVTVYPEKGVPALWQLFECIYTPVTYVGFTYIGLSNVGKTYVGKSNAIK